MLKNLNFTESKVFTVYSIISVNKPSTWDETRFFQSPTYTHSRQPGLTAQKHGKDTYIYTELYFIVKIKKPALRGAIGRLTVKSNERADGQSYL